MTFNQFLKEENIKLKPWQKKIANNFLREMFPYRKGGTGKTFICTTIQTFLIFYGNEYQLPKTFTDKDAIK